MPTRSWYSKNKDKVTAGVLLYQKGLRDKFLNKYGAVCCCCGETDRLVLTLDHIGESGAAARGKYGTGKRRTNNDTEYRKAIARLDRTKYRVLCMNCQFTERQNNRINNPTPRGLESRRRRESLRTRLYAAYGDRCVLCGYADQRALQLDHILGGGTEHHDRRNADGVVLDAITANDPSQYRILCASCNMRERRRMGRLGGKNVRYGYVRGQDATSEWGPLFNESA